MQAHALKSDVMCILPNWRCEETRAAGRRTHQPITAGCKRCAHVQAFSPPVKCPEIWCTSPRSAQGRCICTVTRHTVPLWWVPRNLTQHHPGRHKAATFARLPGIQSPCGECPKIWCSVTKVGMKPLPLHGYQAFSPPVVSARNTNTITKAGTKLLPLHGDKAFSPPCCECTEACTPSTRSAQSRCLSHEQAFSPPVRSVLNNHARSPRSAHGRCLYSYSHISDCSLPLCHFCPCRQGHCQFLSLCQSCAQDFYQYHLFWWLWRQRHIHILCILTPGSIHPRFPQPCSCCARFVSNQIALPRSRAQPCYFPSPSDGHQSGMRKRWGPWHPRQGYLVTKIQSPSSRVVPNSTSQVMICQN